MRIECDKCAAKYSIADEKVRGKTFKIRCKKCSNVIIVRDKAAGADDAAPSESAAADEPAGWHLAIDGETVGPLSEDEVRRRYDAGQIDKTTSTWQEGFEDWIELGQIEAFADLPDRPAAASSGARGGLAGGLGLASAAADDPFASSGSESAFAASSGSNFDTAGGGFASEPAPTPSHSAPSSARGGGGAAAAAAETPRVESLTGQRNENSVLFSLDSLKAMASTAPRPASAGPVRQAPSTTAPSSEGSGLIDIRAMSAMMGDAPASSGHGGGGAEDDMLPTFGGGGLGGLSVEPLVVEPPPTAAPATQEPTRSNAPMYILIGLLTCGLIGLGVMFMMNQDKEPQVIEKVVQVPGQVEEKDDEDKDKEDKEKEDKEKEDDKEEAAETGGAAEAGEAVEDTGGSKPGIKKKKPSGTTTGGSTTVAADPTTTTSGGSSSGGSGGKAEPDVDCLLEPNLPKCKGGGSKSGGDEKKPVDASLPAKLGTAEIKSGIDGVKAAAKTCGGKNGAAAGTKVGIKFSVTGSTGSVSSASAQGEHAGTALGKCVEAEAKKAKFPKFQAEQQGFTFNFTM
jgi:predicted Zn finger-like uncharacterized protein